MKLYNLARVNTATTGTGTITLGAASNGFLTFALAGVSNAETVHYGIKDGANSEVGYGVYTTAGTTLTRNVLKSTNSDAAISLSGSAEVYITPVGADFPMERRAITNTDTVGVADIAAIVSITGSNSFTLSFTAVATLGKKSWGIIQHDGTGEVTLDPASSEQIDGLTTWKLYSGGVIMWQCDGAALYTTLLKPMTATYNASGTFTKPGCGTWARSQCWGGGGSGGRAGSGDGGGGGGGGGYNYKDILLSAYGTTETITIGAGGPAQTSDNTDGTVGGNTTIGSLLTAYGGAPGSGDQSAGAGNGGGGGATMYTVGGTPTTAGGGGGRAYINISGSGGSGGAAGSNGVAGGDVIFGGGGGGGGATGSSGVGGQGGGSVWGGGGGGGGSDGSTSGTGGNGGDTTFAGGGGGGGSDTNAGGSGGSATMFGGNGGAGKTGATAGDPGIQPGGGGGGSETGNSGAGGDGRVIITVF